MYAVDVLAQQTNGLPSWAVAAPAVTAVVAVIALVVREWQRSREDLDQKIQRSVDASLGKTLLEFRDLEAEAKKSLEAASSAATQTSQQFDGLLSEAQEHGRQLKKLLEDAAAIVPQLSAASLTYPSALLNEARSQPPAVALACLNGILDSDAAA